MIEFTIGLAGRIIDVRANFESTLRFCVGYLCHGQPDFSVTISDADLLGERQLYMTNPPEDALPADALSDPFFETLALHRAVCEKLFDFNTLMFHGSVVAVDGVGYLFTAKSGTGKSTHTALWRQLFGDRAVMINDDKPLLRMEDGKVLVYGAPWNGKHQLDTNTCVPLRAICLLERGVENHIRPIPVREALVAMMQQSYRPQNPARMPKYMDLLDGLAQSICFYRLQCNMDIDAARIAFEAMK